MEAEAPTPWSGRERIALARPWSCPHVGGSHPTASDQFFVRVLGPGGILLTTFFPSRLSPKQAEKAGLAVWKGPHRAGDQSTWAFGQS